MQAAILAVSLFEQHVYGHKNSSEGPDGSNGIEGDEDADPGDRNPIACKTSVPLAG